MKTPVKIGLLAAASLTAIALCVHFFGSSRNAGEDPKAAINIGKTETHSGLSSSSSTCSSDNDGFSSRRVLLFADNPHPLSRKLVARLAQQLKDCPLIEFLEVTNQPFTLTNGVAVPDLFLNVNLVELDKSGIVSSTMKSLVTVSLGNSPWQSTSHTMDDSTPPLVAFQWNATQESETTFTGFRTDRYADAARSIGDELAKAIRKQVEELSAKYPALPELPAEFYGPYQPVADLDCLKELQARRAAALCGLFTHNETFWRFQTETNPVPQLAGIVRQLEAAGWKVAGDQMTNGWDNHIRASNAGSILEIFRLRNERMGFSSGEKPPTHFDFVAQYRQPFTRAEREVALEKCFAGQRSVETLLPFLNSFSSAQRQKFYELVEKSPVTSPLACIRLAENYLDRKRTNDAVHLLLRAKAMAATLKDPASVQSGIETLTEKISPKKDLKLEITPEICRELGFLELTNAVQTIEQGHRLGQPLVFFGPGQRGVRICSLTVSPPQKTTYPWLWVEAEDGMRSSSWSSFSPTSRGDWQHTITLDKLTLKITAVPLPDKKSVRFTVSVES